MGKDVIREAFWDPANPNRLALTLRGGVKVILIAACYLKADQWQGNGGLSWDLTTKCEI